MSDSENKLVKNYIAQVKQKLPEWLKWKEEELKNILYDLEQQLYNEARAISGGESLTDADVQEAIMRMGTPESIAKLYKRRGTPRFYITQELIEFYLRSLFFFFGVVFFVNILGAIFQIFGPNAWWEVLGGMINGIWIGCLISAIVITIVFVYFSMEGFLPEDFGIIPKRLAILFPFNFNEEQLEESKIYTKQKIQEAKVLREERMVAAKHRVKEKIIEMKAIEKEKLATAKVLRKQKVEEAKLKREIGKTQPVTIGELIFGTLAGIIFGLILMVQPFAVAGLMQQAFLDWLKMMGFLIFISGLFSLVRLVIGVSNYTGQQVFLVIGAIYNLAYLPLFVLLINQPEIFPISLFSGGIILAIPADPTNIIFIVYFWIIIAIILGTMGGMIGNFFKVGKYSKLKRAY